LKQIQIGKYVFLGAYTMLLYDHLLTLPDEVQTVWKKKKTFPLYLFILVRYYALLAVSVVAYGFFFNRDDAFSLWTLDALPPSRNHDASNVVSWNTHAYSCVRDLQPQ